jgi:hypothetical protein
MANLTADLTIIRYGTPGNASQPVNLPVTANAQLYRGAIAATRSGYAVEMTSPQSTDLVWGVYEGFGPGSADTIPGILGGSTNGAVTVEVATGSFYLNGGTGADAITQVNVGATCYVINENTVGLTSSGGTRPVAGIIESLQQPPNLTGLIAVKMGNSQTTGAPQ